MSSRYIGGYSVGGVVPAIPLALGALTSMLAPQLAASADITARLALPFVPPNPAVLASALASQLANLASILSTMPTADATARINLAAELVGIAALIAPAQEIIASLTAAASTGGLHVYTLSNKTGALGADLSIATAGGLPGGGGPLATSNALVVVTELPSAWAALTAVTVGA